MLSLDKRGKWSEGEKSERRYERVGSYPVNMPLVDLGRLLLGYR
jgi:hypothetical protein